MKKKLVSILLILSMLLGITPVFDITAAAAGAEKVGLSELDNATLKNLGFSTDAEALKAQAASSVSPYGNGTFSLVPQHELLVTRSHDGMVRAYDMVLNDFGAMQFTAKISIPLWTELRANAIRTISFDGAGSGKNNYVATLRVYSMESWTVLLLSIEDPNGMHILIKDIAELPFEVHPENAGAWMSMAVGNFDGSEDGSQELAVYHPFGGKSSRGTIEFYRISVDQKGKSEAKNFKSFELSSAAAKHFADTAFNAMNQLIKDYGITIDYQPFDWKTMYLVPALSMDAVTQSGDAADDLAVAFSVAIDGGKADKIADRISIPKRTPRDAATGVFFLIDAATSNAKTTKSVYMHNTWKEYGVTSKQDKNYAKKYEIMHFGGVGAGDVTGDGMQEVVVAGYAYEQRDGADSDKSWNLSTDEYLATYFTYDPDQKTYNRVDQPMNWISLEKDDYFGATNLGEGIFSNFNSKDVVHAPLQVECFAEQGSGQQESVAIGGIITRLDPQGTGMSDHTPDIKAFVSASFAYGAFNPIYAIPTEFIHETMITYTVQNRLFTQLVAGNFDGNLAGQEQLAFAYLTKENNSDDYSSAYGIISANGSAEAVDVCNVEKENGYRYLGAGIRFFYVVDHHNEGSEDQQAAMGLTIVDCDNDSILMRKTDRPNDYFFSNPYIIAVMQAAPYFDALRPYQADTGETSITKVTGEGTEEEHGVSVGVSVQVGTDFSVAKFGVDFRVGISAEYEKTWAKGNMTTYSVTFTAADENMVALIMTPYVRYHYEVFDLESKTWVPTVVDVPQNPRSSIITVEAYDKVAEQQGWETISKVMPGEDARDKVLYNVPGDPASYAQNAAGLEEFNGAVNTTKSDGKDEDKVEYSKSDFMLVGAGSAASSGQSITIEKTDTINRSWSLLEQGDASIKKGAVVTDISEHVGYVGAYSKIDLTGYSYNSEVVNIPSGYENQYSFEWRFGTWKGSLETEKDRDEMRFPVLGYLVREVKEPVKSPIEAIGENLHVKTPDRYALELSWREAQNEGLGPVQGDGYMLYRYFHGVYYPIANLSSADMVNGWYAFTDANVDPYTEYAYAVRPYKIESNYLSFGDYSALTDAYSVADEENMPRATLRLNKTTNVLSVALTSATGDNLGSLDYRWQKYLPEQGGWLDIPGAIGTEYNIGNEDVSLFRCRVAQRVGTKIYIIYSNTILDNMYVFVAGKTDPYVVGGKTYVDYVLVNENGSVEVVPSANLNYKVKDVYSRSTDATGELILEYNEFTRQRRNITEAAENYIVINGNVKNAGGEVLALAPYSTVWDPRNLVSALSTKHGPLMQKEMERAYEKQVAQNAFLTRLDNVATDADLISLLQNQPIGYAVIGDVTSAIMTSGRSITSNAEQIVNLYFGNDSPEEKVIAVTDSNSLDLNKLPAVRAKDPKENMQVSYAVNADGSLRAAFILQENIKWAPAESAGSDPQPSEPGKPEGPGVRVTVNFPEDVDPEEFAEGLYYFEWDQDIPLAIGSAEYKVPAGTEFDFGCYNENDKYQIEFTVEGANHITNESGYELYSVGDGMVNIHVTITKK